MDQDWSAVTTALLARLHHGAEALDAAREVLPWLADEWQALPNLHSALNLWGRSRYRTGPGGIPLVDPGLLTALSRQAGVPPPTDAHAHAGLQHTYGYLLSQVHTSHGAKRDRWTNPDVEQGLALPPGTWRPPTQHHWLEGLTWLLADLGLWDAPDARKALQPLQDQVDPRLRTVQRRPVARLLEEVQIAGRAVTQRTDVVPWHDPGHPPIAPTGWPGGLVVLSVAEGQGLPRLITAFAMNAAKWTALLAERTGPRVPIRLRYNAWVAGWPAGRTLPGRREVLTLTA